MPRINNKPRIERTCEVCGAKFLVKPSHILRGGGRFCSKNCTKTVPGFKLLKHIKIPCLGCNLPFTPDFKEIDRGGGKYCSRQCYLDDAATPLEIRFKQYIGETTETGCILWSGCLSTTGYGQIFIGRDINRQPRFNRTHRVAWEMANGPIPDGMHVCHHCDNPLCINVEHLFLGTLEDNMADKVAKGRQARGETCSLSVLTEENIRDIRTRYASDNITQKELAEEYGVTISNICAIVNFRSWKHVR